MICQDIHAQTSVKAGGNITATGAGVDSNLLIQGSTVKAGNNATLAADNQVNLLAAKNEASQTSTNSSSSASVGVSYNGSFGFSASASKGQGSANGQDTSFSNTSIQAGNTASLTSGGDTTLKGAVVAANQIKADIGGNLNIESLQDTSTYTSNQSSAGGSVSFGSSGITGGSVNAAKSNINSNFQSVGQQSGLKAGDGGFQVDVGGDTDLTGAVIASTQGAVDANNNSFKTGGSLSITDLQNTASFKANAVGVSASVGTGLDAKGGTIYNPGGSIGIGSASGNASSISGAGISGIAGNTAVRTGDTNTGLQKIFDADKVQKEINAQVAITSAFGQQASKAIGDYAATQTKLADAKKLQAENETDPTKKAALELEAKALNDNWGADGKLRLLAHTVVGGLTGGVGGATGAAAGTLAAPAAAQALADAGITGGLATTLTALASTAAGAIAGGGVAGAGAAFNEVVNNYLSHVRPKLLLLSEKERYDAAAAACSNGNAACQTRDELAALSVKRDAELAQACSGQTPVYCNDLKTQAIEMGNRIFTTPSGYTYANSLSPSPLNVSTIGPAANPRTGTFQDAAARSMAEALLLEAGNQIAGVIVSTVAREAIALGRASMNTTVDLLENMALRNVQVGAISDFRSAEVVNSIMKSVASWEPAWKSGTMVADITLKPGSRVSMVVDADTYALLRANSPDARLGGWATYDNVTSQAYARNQLAITQNMKSNVGYVIELEITRPVYAQVGVVGGQGAAVGGGNQLHFIVPLAERNSIFKYVPNSGKALP